MVAAVAWRALGVSGFPVPTRLLITHRAVGLAAVGQTSGLTGGATGKTQARPVLLVKVGMPGAGASIKRSSVRKMSPPGIAGEVGVRGMNIDATR